MSDGQAPRPYQAPSSTIATGSVDVNDSVTETSFLTIPADTTFIGWVTVISSNRATTASYQTSVVRIDGATATPADDSDILIAGSSSSATSSTVTHYLQVDAGSAEANLNLVNSTATTYDGAACANGIFITKPTIS